MSGGGAGYNPIAAPAVPQAGLPPSVMQHVGQGSSYPASDGVGHSVPPLTAWGQLAAQPVVAAGWPLQGLGAGSHRQGNQAGITWRPPTWRWERRRRCHGVTCWRLLRSRRRCRLVGMAARVGLAKTSTSTPAPSFLSPLLGSTCSTIPSHQGSYHWVRKMNGRSLGGNGVQGGKAPHGWMGSCSRATLATLNRHPRCTILLPRSSMGMGPLTELPPAAAAAAMLGRLRLRLL